MHEPLRSQYLDALGVDVYVPRAVLPAAAVSGVEWLDDGEPVDTAIAASALPAASPAPVPAPALADNPLRHVEIDSPRLSRDSAAAAPSPAKSAVKSATIAQFALSVTIAENGVLLLDDAPATHAERGEYQKLLGNFLFALQRQPVQFGFDVFMWPMLKSAALTQDAAAAREALSAYLYKQVQQRQIQRVLVLGASAQQWCALESSEQLHCIRAVSLLQCLREPLQKRELWHAVRSLATT